MKIICNQKEFASLIRACESGQTFEQCCGCVFRFVCSCGNDFIDDEIMARIEDICEVVSNG